MEVTFTAGPWHAIEYGGYYELQTAPYYGEPSLLNIEDCEEAKANALLAATAPDLLEALQSLLKFMDMNVRDACTLSGYHDAKSAINKALGNGVL